jgi:N-acetylglucosaminyldiphosphoundecaprenol N-acetyl-beta-D-mannosaminyltransferase
MNQNCGQKYRKILGINFFIGTPKEALEIGLSGGLVLVPAAPALIEIQRDKSYRQALLDADLVITDSGLLVLLWRLFFWEKIIRFSGLEYLRLLLEREEVRDPSNTAWIMPQKQSMERNIRWLNSQSIRHSHENCYLAPAYPPGEINDSELMKWLEVRRPKHIIIALGGGTQERLGRSLQRSLTNRPGIHCIGAAIGFLSGDQVHIPKWADYLYLGWLFRCVSEPKKFVPRYYKAFRLIPLFIRYKEGLPPVID